MAPADMDSPISAPAAAGLLNSLANYLTTGYWQSYKGRDTSPCFDLSSVYGNNGTLYYNVTGWSTFLSSRSGSWEDPAGISAGRQVLVREAFNIYEAALGIHFVETTSEGGHVDFFFMDFDTGAWEADQPYSLTGIGSTDYAIINVEPGWDGGSSNIGGDTFQAFMHEIGHALGLGHQGSYNESASFGADALWLNDSWTQSMMSYFDQNQNTWLSTDSWAQLISPMAVDWIALNNIYGPQGYGVGNAFNGDTIYGVGTNITAAESLAFADLTGLADTNAFTIVDGSGVDAVDFSNYSVDQTIRLGLSSGGSTQAVKSSVGGLVDNMTIAVGTVIENATTGDGNDSIYGNSSDNVLTSNGGNDDLYGYGGDDTLSCGEGDDTAHGGAGSDRLKGGGGADTLYAESGDDYLSGDDGNDTLLGGDGADPFWAETALIFSRAAAVPTHWMAVRASTRLITAIQRKACRST